MNGKQIQWCMPLMKILQNKVHFHNSRQKWQENLVQVEIQVEQSDPWGLQFSLYSLEPKPHKWEICVLWYCTSSHLHWWWPCVILCKLVDKHGEITKPLPCSWLEVYYEGDVFAWFFSSFLMGDMQNFSPCYISNEAKTAPSARF